MKLSIPKAMVDNTYELLEPGTYAGSIADAQIRHDEDNGRARLRLSLNGLRSIGATPETNRRSFTFEIPVQWDFKSVADVESLDADTPFPLRLGIGLLGGLGTAVGVAERDDAGNVVADPEEVFDYVVDGSAAGMEIAFSMQHRSYKFTDQSGNEVERTVEDVKRIGPAS